MKLNRIHLLVIACTIAFTFLTLYLLLVHNNSDDAMVRAGDGPCDFKINFNRKFCNSNLSFQERIDDLINLLTLDEKVSLLGNDARAIVRLGIPKHQWWNEALHGIATSPGVTFDDTSTPFSTAFPQVVLTAASFDKDLFYKIGAVIGTEARAMFNSFTNLEVPIEDAWKNRHAHLTLWAPNINIFRDARWGRGQETPGEDPLLSSVYAREFVQGIQQGGRRRSLLKVVKRQPDFLLASACCKHFFDYNLEVTENGTRREAYNAIASRRDIFDTYLPAFEACVNGKASGVMCSYNSVNGIPSCANREFITETLRNKFNFDGYVTGDCGAVSDVYYEHNYTSSFSETLTKTLEAGTDVDCGNFYQKHFTPYLAVKNEHLINRSVKNLLSVQFRLGLFETRKNAPFWHISYQDDGPIINEKLALYVAESGIVLLKNVANSLPLRDCTSLVLIGPFINSKDVMLGNYHGNPPFVKTVSSGLGDLCPGSIPSESLCNDVFCTSFKIDSAIHIVKRAKSIIITLGNDLSIENEGLDRTNLLLAGRQGEVVTAIHDARSLDSTIILLLFGGSPIDISPILPLVDAVLWVGYPGQAGGEAIANILLGKTIPSGRLPFTMFKNSYSRLIPHSDSNMRPSFNILYWGEFVVMLLLTIIL